MKKIICALLAAVIVFLCLPVSVFAANTVYYVGDDITVTIDPVAKTLSVTGTGSLPDYASASAAPWYGKISSYTKVTVGGGIDYVGKRCFYGSRYLKEVVLEEGVCEIGESAFSKSSALTSLSLPSTLVKIDSYAFYSATSLVSVSLPDSLEYVGEYAFSGCSLLEKVSLPESLSYLDATAFNSTKFYKALPNGLNLLDGFTLSYKGSFSGGSLVIPNGARIISAGTLRDSSAVTSVTIPDTVEAVLDFAFYNDSSLKSVTVPDSVKYIGAFALGYTSDNTYDIPVVNKNFTIRGHGGFASESYAAEHGIAFECLCEEGGFISLPNCLEGGEGVIGCRYCGKALRAEVVAPKSAHSFGDVTVTPASCTEDGVTKKVCLLCGYADATTTVPAKGHVPSSEPVIILPTCTESGRVYYVCSVCGEECGNSVPILPTGHTAGEEKISLDPTCTEPGAAETVCAVCGEVISTRELPATGHKTSDAGWEVLVKPTRTSRGFAVNRCTVCGVAAEYKYTDCLASPGDVNGDGSVTAYDLVLLKTALAGGFGDGATYESCDIDGDLSITARDVEALKTILAS